MIKVQKIKYQKTKSQGTKDKIITKEKVTKEILLICERLFLQKRETTKEQIIYR